MDEALQAVPVVTDPSWPIAAARVGDAVAGALAAPDALRDAAERFAAAAAYDACEAVIGASPLGDQLAAAIASLHGLPLFDISNPVDRVLIVDGVLATGAAVSLAADRLRGQGATHLTAAVLIDLAATEHMAGALAVREVGR